MWRSCEECGCHNAKVLEDIDMYVYTTDQIRNVVVLGHGGCGKTSLVEAMAHVSGLTSRIGKVWMEIH